MLPISQVMNVMGIITRSRFIAMTLFMMRLLEPRVKLEINPFIIAPQE